jgi:hypothetical protein
MAIFFSSHFNLPFGRDRIRVTFESFDGLDVLDNVGNIFVVFHHFLVMAAALI